MVYSVIFVIIGSNPHFRGVVLNQQSENRRKGVFCVVLVSSILLGLTLLTSGTGKVPGQTEFIDALLNTLWTPAVAYFVGYLLPWAEIVMGVLLLLGIYPRIVAALCLPLTAGFAGNNIWALLNGVEEFPECMYCFGIWEEFFGALSPTDALIVDVVLFCLALLILVLHRESFLEFRPWFIKRRGTE